MCNPADYAELKESRTYSSPVSIQFKSDGIIAKGGFTFTWECITNADGSEKTICESNEIDDNLAGTISNAFQFSKASFTKLATKQDKHDRNAQRRQE